MKNLLIIILLPFTILSQNRNTFRIEFNTDFRGYEMNEFNERINNPAFIDTSLYDELSRISLSEGFNFGMSISYRPFKFISLGVYGGYQYGSVKRDLRFVFYQGGNGIPNDTLFLERRYEAQSYNAGLNAKLIFNQMNFWSKYSLLKKIESGLNIQVGYGWTSLMTYDSSEEYGNEDFKGYYYAQGVQLTSSFKIGYILTKNNYFSSIGLSLGYQYYVTSDLQAEGGLFFPNNEKTKLDFSGFNIGLYLSIGR